MGFIQAEQQQWMATAPLHCVTCKRKDADIENGKFDEIPLLSKFAYGDFKYFRTIL